MTDTGGERQCVIRRWTARKVVQATIEREREVEYKRRRFMSSRFYRRVQQQSRALDLIFHTSRGETRFIAMAVRLFLPPGILMLTLCPLFFPAHLLLSACKYESAGARCCIRMGEM